MRKDIDESNSMSTIWKAQKRSLRTFRNITEWAAAPSTCQGLMHAGLLYAHLVGLPSGPQGLDSGLQPSEIRYAETPGTPCCIGLLRACQSLIIN